MSSVWIREFTGGLDARRLPEVSNGDVLVVAQDGHITRGGAFEKRAAFVKTHTLPAGTFGLSANNDSLHVFGSDAAPVMPSGVVYSRLQNPSGAMTRIFDTDMFAGKLYVSAGFQNSDRAHYYDGNIIDDWNDGRARAVFRVSGSGDTLATVASGRFEIGSKTGSARKATGSFEIMSGTTGAGNSLDSVQINGVELLDNPVIRTATNSGTATAVAAEITSYSGTSGYTAQSDGQYVIISTVAETAAPNGQQINTTVTGVFVIANATTMSGGVNPVAASVVQVTVNGVSLLAAPVSMTGTLAELAADVADGITAYASTPDYNVSVSGSVVTLTAGTGQLSNGYRITVSYTGDIETAFSTLFDGGSDAGVSSVAQVLVSGVNIITSPVLWDTDASVTALAIADQITANSVASGYSAYQKDDQVIVVANAAGTAANDRTIKFVLTGGMEISPGLTTLGGGQAEAVKPGDSVQTSKSKVYSTSGSVMFFSGVNAPDKWNTDTIGAGFIDMSSESSGSEELVGVARYQNMLAVFAKENVQIWFTDPDPTLYRQVQVLDNTGAVSNRSITRFGDTDLFYLDLSGLRSLKARDSSSAAATSDIGLPVDSLVIDKLLSMTEDEQRNIIGLIEPRDKRFWLIMGDQIFVFTYYADSKVSAWSTYKPGFVISDAIVFKRKLYVRSGNNIYVYGGPGSALVYDTTAAEAWLPYLDMSAPAGRKQVTAIDAAVRGAWDVSIAMDPNLQEAEELVATLTETSYAQLDIPAHGYSTHVSIRARSRGDGPCIFAAVVLHFESGDEG
jgi:hypothetical protein